VVLLLLLTGLPPAIAVLSAASHAVSSPPGLGARIGAVGSAAPPMVVLPHPRDVSQSFLPGGLVIDPNQSYVSEPAPMGITDYGVTPSGVGYEYATPVVQASATIDSFAVSDSSAGTNMTFQLNVEDVVVSGLSTFVFWVQDVAFFDTHSDVIFWEDNVWNLSGGSGNLYSSSVAGNGSVYSNVYYADVAAGYPGSGVALSEPTTITARVVASNASGAPHVGFEYEDGSGWVTFDNVTFPFTSVGVNGGFLVDGFSYTPSGGYFDAEWDLSGPGGGLTQTTRAADLNLSLSVWNGHNFQAVRAAYNHGGNTAETMSNVVDQFAANNSTGALYAHAVNGTGGLAALYGPGDTSTLRIATTNVSAGTIDLNRVGVPFVGALANLTLAPGVYAVNLTVNGTVVGATNVSLTAGEFVSITLVPYVYYPLRFVSVGLPSDAAWSVTVAGTVLSGNLSTLATSLRSGTFPYVVGGVAGYYLSTYDGVAVVPGPTSTVTLTWLPSLYVSEFIAENDPGGVLWSVSVDGQNVSGTATTLSVWTPNGTFEYVATAPRSETIYPATGPAVVDDVGATVDISFSLAPAQLRGAVDPGNAQLTVGGVVKNVTEDGFNLSLAPGNYAIVAALVGYETFYANVTLVAGASTSLNITLVPEPASPSPHPSSGPSGFGWTDWAIVGVVAVALATLTALVVTRRPRGPSGPAR
jgi:hypothetical protein